MFIEKIIVSFLVVVLIGGCSIIEKSAEDKIRILDEPITLEQFERIFGEGVQMHGIGRTYTDICDGYEIRVLYKPSFIERDNPADLLKSEIICIAKSKKNSSEQDVFLWPPKYTLMSYDEVKKALKIVMKNMKEEFLKKQSQDQP